MIKQCAFIIKRAFSIVYTDFFVISKNFEYDDSSFLIIIINSCMT